MSKQKTKKAVAKRFKITPSGKILRGRQMKNHLKSAKSTTAIRRYKTVAKVSDIEKKNIERMLPYN
ncbi:MAG: 50S ribosomal protein L35 [Patescibacteria group bacterium]